MTMSKDLTDWTTDPFSTRYGYIPGRCNAFLHRRGHAPKMDGLCKRYPMKDARRCARHGGRGNQGGWHTGNRKWLHCDPDTPTGDP